MLLLPWNPRTGLTEPNIMSFADGLFTSQHSGFVRFFYYSTATGVTAWPNIYYVFEGSRKKKKKKILGSSAPPTFCTLSLCFGRTILLAAERLFSFLIGSAASRIHCPCVLHVNSQTPCCFPPYIPSDNPLAQYSWHYGTFRRFLCSFVYIFAADSRSAPTLVTKHTSYFD